MIKELNKFLNEEGLCRLEKVISYDNDKKVNIVSHVSDSVEELEKYCDDNNIDIRSNLCEYTIVKVREQNIRKNIDVIFILPKFMKLLLKDEYALEFSNLFINNIFQITDDEIIIHKNYTLNKYCFTWSDMISDKFGTSRYPSLGIDFGLENHEGILIKDNILYKIIPTRDTNIFKIIYKRYI